MRGQLELLKPTDWRRLAPRKFYPCGGCGARQAHRSGTDGVACRACGGYVPYGDLVGSPVQTRILALRITAHRPRPARRS